MIDELNEIEELREMYHTHFLVFSIKSFQKFHIWTALVTAFCCMRAANKFTVLMAFLMLLARAIQGSSLFPQKYGIAKFGYVMATFCLYLMWFSEFGKESADIVHDTEPTEEIVRNAKLMSINYRP